MDADYGHVIIRNDQGRMYGWGIPGMYRLGPKAEEESETSKDGIKQAVVNDILTPN